MDKKEQVLELFKDFSDENEDGQKLIYLGDYDELAEEIVKLFAIPVVSQRSELFNLLNWMQDENEFSIGDINEILEDYNYYKLNCG